MFVFFFFRPKVNRPPPPFNNLEFVIVGKLETDKDELKSKISKNGGKVSTKIHSKTFAVISTKGTVPRINFDIFCFFVISLSHCSVQLRLSDLAAAWSKPKKRMYM